MRLCAVPWCACLAAYPSGFCAVHRDRPEMKPPKLPRNLDVQSPADAIMDRGRGD